MQSSYHKLMNGIIRRDASCVQFDREVRLNGHLLVFTAPHLSQTTTLSMSYANFKWIRS